MTTKDQREAGMSESEQLLGRVDHYFHCLQEPTYDEIIEFVERERALAYRAGAEAQRERADALDKAIREAIEMIPGSMGGHVTLGLNILQKAIRSAPIEGEPK